MNQKQKVLKRKLGFFAQPVLDVLRKQNYRMAYYFARYFREGKVDEGTILYESRDGQSMTDSPYALFRYLLDHEERYGRYQHIWVLKADVEGREEMMKRYAHLSNVTFVTRNTRAYVKQLTRAEYLINNSTFQAFFVPNSAQKYINTWHGTPLKLMGFDMPGNPSNSQNVVRNFLAARYLISPNPHTSEMFRKSYKMDGIYTGEILESGYPRIDLTLNTSKQEVQAHLKGRGLRLDETLPTIMYAPTWKGNSVSSPSNDVKQIEVESNKLRTRLQGRYNVLVKVHPFLYKKAAENAALVPYLVPDTQDTNEVLSMVDVLITDYSSIFFDFLVTGKPILFYVWDRDLYEYERGMYMKLEELPGPTCTTVDDVLTTIDHLDEVTAQYADVYRAAQETYTSYEDGRSSERVIEHIFAGNPIGNSIRLQNDKKKLLIYPGGMRNNGITSSMINLTNNIDYDKYDVVLFGPPPSSDEVINNFSKVSKHVKYLFKTGVPVYTIMERYFDKAIYNRSLVWYLRPFFPLAAYQREMRKQLGNLHFDTAIDFSGYSYFWGKFIVAADSDYRVCYMHNDLYSDSRRKVGNKKPHWINLRGLFSIYPMFDKLLSVSEATMELNKEKLNEYAPEEKFGYCINTIDPDKILYTPSVKTEDVSTEATVLKKYRVELAQPGLSFIVFKSLNEVKANEGQPFTLPSDEAEIRVVAEWTSEEGTFVKILVADEHIGWSRAEHFVAPNDRIEHEEKVSRIGYLKNPQRHGLWSHPYNTPGARRLFRLQGLNGALVHVSGKVETERSTYVEVSIAGRRLGWIDHRAVQTNPQNVTNEEREKAEQSFYLKHPNYLATYETLAKRFANQSSYLLTRQVAYQAQLSNTTEFTLRVKPSVDANVVKVPTREQLYNVDREVRTAHGMFVRLKDVETNEVIGWVKRNEVVKVVGDDQPSTVFDYEKDLQPGVRPFTFVNMGRLSPEKNQVALIQAFDRLHREFPDTQLLILGEGPLRGDLEDAIAATKLEGAARLLGQQENPFRIMENCDAFVLSSMYEGQPMVLLEALTLGMKIVATDIVANKYVLSGGEYGLLTKGTTPEAIYEGLKEMYLNPDMTFKSFDYAVYNREAIQQFYDNLQAK